VRRRGYSPAELHIAPSIRKPLVRDDRLPNFKLK